MTKLLMTSTRVYVVLFSLLFSCSKTTSPAPTPSTSMVLPTVPLCDSACSNLRALACSEGNQPDAGATCEHICQQVHVDGDKFRFDYECASKAHSQDDVRKCSGFICK